MFTLRTMVRDDFDEVAGLIYLSTNIWYQSNRGHSVFEGDPSVCRVFCEVYEELDPGCGIVAVHAGTDTIIGSCFYHPREMHVSLGIMNVHPSYFGLGVASRILDQIVAFARESDLPLRLVSSAMNLDSFSLYNRIGFAPFAAYQDMVINIPKNGIKEVDSDDGEDAVSDDEVFVRKATLDDVDEMGKIEFEISGISREKDYRYLIENRTGIWHTLVAEDNKGRIVGYLSSIDDPGSRMIGPGVSQTAEAAEGLLLAQFERFCGRSVVFLLPVNRPDIVERMYARGAKNCEIHFGQVLGESQPVRGIVMPSFLPETA